MKFNKHLEWITLLASAVAMLIASQGAMAAVGSVVGSKHDFSTTGPNATYNGTSTQVCVYCHAPHNTGGTTPLWNHATTAATFQLYASPSLNATVAQPGGVSKLCLSCHDGTVAVDSFGGATGTKLISTGGALLGSDLRNDHPIGFTYDAALVTADPGLQPITTAVTIGSGNSGTIESKMLSAGKVECSSCHDVHRSTAGTAVEAKLLKITTAGSALCVACHIK